MLTPLDIQKKEFKRSFRGYNEEEVDGFLDQLLQSYESVYLENQSLKEKLEASEAAKARYQEMEKIIKDAVIMAQKNADDLVNNARQEADVLLNEARFQAEKIIGEAENKAGLTLQEARERAKYRIAEAEDRVRVAMDEYRYLKKQVDMFRVKFRSFLEAQLSLLNGQEKEAQELLSRTGPGWAEAAVAQSDLEDQGEDSNEALVEEENAGR